MSLQNKLRLPAKQFTLPGLEIQEGEALVKLRKVSALPPPKVSQEAKDIALLKKACLETERQMTILWEHHRQMLKILPF